MRTLTGRSLRETSRNSRLASAMLVLLNSATTQARSCPMPSLEQEFDDSFAVVRAEPRVEVQIGSDLVVLVKVKSVYKGSQSSWAVWNRSDASSFNVPIGEDGVWFLRRRVWGLPRMTDCGHSTSVSNATVMGFLATQAEPQPPDSIALGVAVTALLLFVLVLLIVRRIRRTAVSLHPHRDQV